MSARHRGLRSELAAILDVDLFTLQDTSPDSVAPTEPTTAHLANLIYRSVTHSEEARTIYEFLPALMYRVFGYAPGQGWLETASELPSRDREALVRLIIPEGPVHTFCQTYSPPRDSKLSVATDMRFEFPRSSIPQHTNDALEQGSSAALKKSIKDGQSFLAPFLESSLRDKKDDILYLAPLDYFFICMIASPAQKWARVPGSSVPGGRRVKRSVSLPSTRALYNQVVASYASSLNGIDSVDDNSIFIATCLDFLFVPWASCIPPQLPVISTCAAETVASVLLALAPTRPEALDLNVDFRPSGIPDFIDWKTQTNTSALYRAAETMLESLFMNLDTTSSSGTLIVYIRTLALYIAPWRASIRSTLKAQLFPKPKPASSANGNVPTMAALTSRLSSINAQLASHTRSPGNASEARESHWRSELRTRQKFVDEELVRLAVVKAANRRIPSLIEGGKCLVMLAEAACAARVNGGWDSPGRDPDTAEEVRNCLVALRNQKLESERHTGRKDRNYITPLASSLGIRLEGNGVLSGISEIVGAGGAGSVAGVVGMVAGSRPSTPGSISKIRDRRLRALRAVVEDDVPFIGDVWDRPIAESESEIVVLWLYWLALRLEPRLGFVPNLRFLGQYWFLLLSSVALITAYLITRLVRIG